MLNFLSEYQKNFWNRIMFPAFGDTIKMVVITAILATVLGFLIAVILLITDEDGIYPNRVIYQIATFLVNVLRSVPFVILMVFLLPFTKSLVGISYGVKAAIIPLTVGAAAFIARIIENAMKEVDPKLIQAMRSFGISDFQIIFNVILSEAAPAIISGVILATVSILGATAVAGTMGAGGIGNVAIVYGYQSFNNEIMFLTTGILVVMVQGIQSLGNWIYKKMK